MKKHTNLQQLFPLALGAALAAAFVWYYDVYIRWQPALFPFTVVALALGVVALTLLALWVRGERKALALVWKPRCQSWCSWACCSAFRRSLTI